MTSGPLVLQEHAHLPLTPLCRGARRSLGRIGGVETIRRGRVRGLWRREQRLGLIFRG